MVFSVALVIASLIHGVDPEAAEPHKDPVTIRLGSTQFSAQRVQLETAGANGRQYRCMLLGDAKLSLYKDDVRITGEKIRLEAKGNGAKSVICLGSCRYQHNDGTMLSGDKLMLDADGLRMTGNVRLQSKETVLTGDTISFRNGKAEVE